MGTGTSEDACNLLTFRGPTRGEGMQGIEPASPDPVQPTTFTGRALSFRNVFKGLQVHTACKLDNISVARVLRKPNKCVWM